MQILQLVLYLAVFLGGGVAVALLTRGRPRILALCALGVGLVGVILNVAVFPAMFAVVGLQSSWLHTLQAVIGLAAAAGGLGLFIAAAAIGSRGSRAALGQSRVGEL